MPALDETKELIVLDLEEWEKLPELDLGDNIALEDGSSYQEKRLVIKDFRSLYDQANDVIYPYVTYYNKKGAAITERLVRCDRIIRAIFVKVDDSEDKGRYDNFLEVITAAQGLEGLKQIRMAYTSDIYNWYEKIVKLRTSLVRDIFPLPVLIRKYVGVAYEELPNTTRNYYEIVALDKIPA